MIKTRASRHRVLAWAMAIALVPICAHAQDERTRVVWDVTRGVLLDPTTYTPAMLAYTSQRLDWKSSQVFFEHGWLEQNRLFTVSGRVNDVPISYRAGVRVIGGNALSILQASVVNNLAAGVGERLLLARYPKRRKLWRTIGWVERISFASYLSYVSSAEHWRQIKRNGRLVEQYGY
jgi:hypothetical protein